MRRVLVLRAYEPMRLPVITHRGLAVGLAAFTALSAVSGGLELILWRPQSPVFPLTLLEHTPFHTFLIPGLLLALVVGGTSFVAAGLVWRRARRAIDAEVIAGGALTVWIVAEVAMLRSLHWLHVVYGVIGLMMLWLGLRGAWRARSPRYVWLLAVTAAEAIGFLIPMAAGILSTRFGVEGTRQAAVLVAAGALEGLVLGAAQAWAFPLPLHRMRFAVLTGCGAALVWALAMFVPMLSAPPSTKLFVSAAALAVGLCAMGGAQWLELRRHSPHPTGWIAWTALAWVLALPLSFAPAPFVDETTPIAAVVALWACAALMMAYVVARVTWAGVRRVSLPLRIPLRQQDA